MRHRPCLAFCLIAAACDDTEADRIAAAPPGALQAGEWEIVFEASTTISGSKSGDQPSRYSSSHSRYICIPPTQAARPDPGVFLESKSKCRYDRFAMGGGMIDAVLKCDGDTMRVRGTYEAGRFQVTPHREGWLRSFLDNQDWSTSGRHVGDCRAQAKG
jgi:uncharacterized protein DUF3617